MIIEGIEIKKALIIKKEWLDLILSGEKHWEMRSNRTLIRGDIALIESKSGLIKGIAKLTDSLPRIFNENQEPPIPSLSNYLNHYAAHHLMTRKKQIMRYWLNIELHCIDDLKLIQKWPYPWVLTDAKKLDYPIPYNHPKGAVIWVNI